MLTFKSFTGINNVLPPERLGEGGLTTALNVDIGQTGELRRRGGYARESQDCHKNLWQAQGFMLATVGSELVAFGPPGRHVVSPAIGSSSRVWYCSLPDGRAVFSNGHISGTTDGRTGARWGVPSPDSAGTPMAVSGGLHKGRYRYLVTHVRLSDGLEGAPIDGGEVEIGDAGGFLVTGIPTPEGHGANVYLSGHGGGECFLAGAAAGPAFSYLGANDALALPCRTLHEAPMPAGRLLAFWRGRTLVARGDTLYASQPHRWEARLPARDFKQFPSDITLVQPVEQGIFVGTEQALYFLGGTQFDALAQSLVLDGRVVLGSGCMVSGEKLRRGDSVSSGAAMVCIAGRNLVAGFGDGSIFALDQYTTDAREVASTFRVSAGVPQYLASVLA